MTRPTAALGVSLALTALLAAPARAADDPARRGFDPDPVRPALSLRGAFTVETAEPAPEGARALGARLEYTRGLLALRLGGARDQVLEERLRLHLGGALSLGRIELAASLPVVLWQRADFGLLERQGVTGPLVAPVARTAMGDLRLGAKALLVDEGRAPVGLAATAELRLPTGDGDAFAGDGLAFLPGAVATRHLGRARLDLAAGYLFRRPGQYAQLVVHDGVTWGAAATVDLPPLARLRSWEALLELTGGIPRGLSGASDRYRAPLSARAGLRARLGRSLEGELGLGAGLGEAGAGREVFRIFLGVRAAGGGAVAAPEARPGDRDGDGVPDAVDRCPDDPGPAALDGCPDADGDEIADRDDACPDQPGPAQNRGCPVSGETLVEIETERLSLKDAIHFDTGQDTIKPESSPVLDAIARVLSDHPELKRIRVEGHTDNVGGAAYNKDLSRRRAAQVVRALVARGVAAERLSSEGYGFERPVAPNDTSLNRARNRRVEFTILPGR